MRYSPEALTAFVEAVDSGSFSAAARRLRKSQSTISTAIANLEADLGVILFDRATRQPTLTPQGEQVLSYVKAILAASERLDELAVSLSGETEPRLTFVLSDTLHPDVLEDLLVQFDRRFPHTEFECLIGEDEDVIDLLQKSRAQVGLIEARERYPTDIGSTRLPLQTAMGIYVAPGHPLAAQGKVAWDELRSWRELRLSTFLASATEPAAGQVWSAPNYLLLLSMAARGSAGAFCPARWWRSLRRRAGWWRSISPAGRGQFQSICCGIRKRRRERPAAGCVSTCSGVNVNE
ncbi:TPA: LysR family transcriptional regulator [Klebsiella pneumoniae]